MDFCKGSGRATPHTSMRSTGALFPHRHMCGYPTCPFVRHTRPCIRPTRPCIRSTRPCIRPTRPCVCPTRPCVNPTLKLFRPHGVPGCVHPTFPLLSPATLPSGAWRLGRFEIVKQPNRKAKQQAGKFCYSGFWSSYIQWMSQFNQQLPNPPPLANCQRHPHNPALYNLLMSFLFY